MRNADELLEKDILELSRQERRWLRRKGYQTRRGQRRALRTAKRRRYGQYETPTAPKDRYAHVPYLGAWDVIDLHDGETVKSFSGKTAERRAKTHANKLNKEFAG